MSDRLVALRHGDSGTGRSGLRALCRLFFCLTTEDGAWGVVGPEGRTRGRRFLALGEQGPRSLRKARFPHLSVPLI